MSSTTHIPLMSLPAGTVQFTINPPATDSTFTLSLDRGMEGGLNQVAGAQLDITMLQSTDGGFTFQDVTSGGHWLLAGGVQNRVPIITGTFTANSVPLLLILTLTSNSPLAIQGSCFTS